MLDSFYVYDANITWSFRNFSLQKQLMLLL
jgi:hypothetical protein